MLHRLQEAGPEFLFEMRCDYVTEKGCAETDGDGRQVTLGIERAVPVQSGALHYKSVSRDRDRHLEKQTRSSVESLRLLLSLERLVKSSYK